MKYSANRTYPFNNFIPLAKPQDVLTLSAQRQEQGSTIGAKETLYFKENEVMKCPRCMKS